MTRRGFLQAASVSIAVRALPASQRPRLGVAWTSYMTAAKPKTAIELLEHCHTLGAAGIQAPLNGDLAHLRRRAEYFGMYLEGMVALPSSSGAADFEKRIADAKSAGAVCVRSAALSGRRYETFQTIEDWRKFVAASHAAIEAALPILEKYKMPLALENHKDWTADELAALMKKYSSEYFGVCLDFGNNIALLDDPMNVVDLLAPYTIATHMKDMAVEPYPDGFLLSEVVLGQGFLDLPRMISAIRAARPATRFSLEMITRDPLRVPCLTDKYWIAFPERNGVFLARTMQLVQKRRSATALPRMSELSQAGQLRAEEENVGESIQYAKAQLGF